MSKNSEIEHIAKCLFEIEISLGQLSAYDEGLDKLFGLPSRSKWKGMGDIQKWWVGKAKEYIKEQGINLDNKTTGQPIPTVWYGTSCESHYQET